MGYAFEPMQRRWGALWAGLLMGVPWAVWHYPSILAQGHDFAWILWGTLGTVAVRVLIVWIYSNTNVSLFACIAFHALYNTGRPLFPHDHTLNPLVDYPAIHYGVIAVIALLVASVWMSRKHTRSQIE
jgi:membrane protease YdiL (CAAX protease family)